MKLLLIGQYYIIQQLDLKMLELTLITFYITKNPNLYNFVSWGVYWTVQQYKIIRKKIMNYE